MLMMLEERREVKVAIVQNFSAHRTVLLLPLLKKKMMTMREKLISVHDLPIPVDLGLEMIILMKEQQHQGERQKNEEKYVGEFEGHGGREGEGKEEEEGSMGGNPNKKDREIDGDFSKEM